MPAKSSLVAPTHQNRTVTQALAREFSVEQPMTQQPPEKPEQTTEEQSSAKKRSFIKPTLKKLGKPEPDYIPEEFQGETRR